MKMGLNQTERAEIIKALCDFEEKRLKKQYPDNDAWRSPENFADAMASVGFAMIKLNDYKNELANMSDEELAKLYKSYIVE